MNLVFLIISDNKHANMLKYSEKILPTVDKWSLQRQILYNSSLIATRVSNDMSHLSQGPPLSLINLPIKMQHIFPAL